MLVAWLQNTPLAEITPQEICSVRGIALAGQMMRLSDEALWI
jgi:hypothetical protein